jgi:hypothetical protein
MAPADRTPGSGGATVLDQLRASAARLHAFLRDPMGVSVAADCSTVVINSDDAGMAALP